MKVALKNAGVCRKTLKIEVPAEDVAQERAELLSVYAKGVALPGFRKGRAPKHLVEKKFAKEMTADLKDRIVPKFYHEAVRSEELNIVSVVDVGEPALEDGKPLTFEVTVDVEPEFKIPKYRGISIKTEKTDVDEKQVDDMVMSIRRQQATFEDIDNRPAAEGDMVQVSYESTLDGDPLEQKVPEARGMGQGSGYWITCDDESFLPGMGRALIGASIGDRQEIPVEFPADFIVKELAGLKADFKVEVTGLRETKLPDFDEAFLEKLRVESEQELRDNIRTHLEEQAAAREKNRQQDLICEHLLKKTRMEVPETAVQQQTRSVLYDLTRQRMARGMTQEQIGAQRDDLVEEAKTKAEEQVRLRYILRAIAEAESIGVDDQEVSAEIARMAVQRQQDAGTLRGELEKEGQLDAVREQIQVGKTIEFLLEHAKIK